jgi:hypothetical protein
MWFFILKILKSWRQWFWEMYYWIPYDSIVLTGYWMQSTKLQKWGFKTNTNMALLKKQFVCFWKRTRIWKGFVYTIVV